MIKELKTFHFTRLMVEKQSGYTIILTAVYGNRFYIYTYNKLKPYRLRQNPTTLIDKLI